MGRKRSTRQKEIISQVLGRIESFFDAFEIYELARKEDKSIGMATVYRYLREAKLAGELYSYRCDRRTVYSKGRKSHCHFKCMKTGKIIHFELDNIDFLKDKIPGSINSFQLEVKGVCRDCS